MREDFKRYIELINLIKQPNISSEAKDAVYKVLDEIWNSLAPEEHKVLDRIINDIKI